MISCRKGARSNVRDEIDMRSPCVCDRILFERRKGDGKEAISSSLLGKVTMKRYQGLQDRDFESINCEQRAKPSSFVVPYVDFVADRCVAAVQSLAPCILLRHLADRAVQAGLFKLVPRGCCVSP